MRQLLTIAAVAVLVTLIATSLQAQVVANDAYELNYIRGTGAVNPGDNQLFLVDRFKAGVRVINTGQVGSPIDPGTNHGTVCADIYIFDINQEMLECCSCPITANGLLFFNNNQTLLNTLTGVFPESAVVKIVADLPSSGKCHEQSITSPVNGGLRSFAVHDPTIVICTGGGCGFSTDTLPTETEFQRAPLTVAEAAFLGNACSFVQYLGSGKGRCFCPKEPAS